MSFLLAEIMFCHHNQSFIFEFMSILKSKEIYDKLVIQLYKNIPNNA
jgi:hypothetical protein